MATKTAGATLGFKYNKSDGTTSAGTKTFSKLNVDDLPNGTSAKSFAQGYSKIVDGTLDSVTYTTAEPVDLN